jgi:hypothetical protein
MGKLENVSTILPVDREWVIALSVDDGMLAAFDSQTLDPLFEGRYIAPTKFGRRDPRKWSSRTFEKLKWEFGLYGGTHFRGATFVMAEVALLRARQRPVEWCISVRSSTSVFMLGGLEFERDVLLEVEDGRAVHGEVAAV